MGRTRRPLSQPHPLQQPLPPLTNLRPKVINAAAVAAAVGPVQGAEGTPPEVVLAHPLLGKALRMKAPKIPPAKKVCISSTDPPTLFPVVLNIRLFFIQPKMPMGAVVEVVAAAAAEVIGMVIEVIEVVTVADDVNTIVTARQARRTYLHSPERRYL